MVFALALTAILGIPAAGIAGIAFERHCNRRDARDRRPFGQRHHEDVVEPALAERRQRFETRWR